MLSPRSVHGRLGYGYILGLPCLSSERPARAQYHCYSTEIGNPHRVIRYFCVHDCQLVCEEQAVAPLPPCPISQQVMGVMRRIPAGSLPLINWPIDLETLESCARLQPNNKSPGDDGQPREFCKQGTMELLELYWKAINAYVWMHAIASAIAGSLRTSTAPTGSRPLPPPGFPPPRLDAQPRERPRGRLIQLWGNQLSSATGQRGGYPTSSLSHTGRSAGAMAASGRPSCRSTRWSTRSQLQGRQPSRGSTRWRPGMQRALFIPLQVVRSSDGLDFPWVAGPAAGLRSGPPGNSSSQGRQSKSLAYAVAAHLRQAILPLSSYGSFGRAMASTPPGSRCLQDAVDHPGSSSSDRRPAAGLRSGGLSKWLVHSELTWATRDLRGPAQLRDAGCHPGTSGRKSSRGPTRWQSLRVACFTAGYTGPLGVVGWPELPRA
jgi:hypothetical protein